MILWSNVKNHTIINQTKWESMELDNKIPCGLILGALGGASVTVWAATHVWPLITSAVPGGAGVVCAISASVGMCMAGCCIGSVACQCIAECALFCCLIVSGVFEFLNDIIEIIEANRSEQPIDSHYIAVT